MSEKKHSDLLIRLAGEPGSGMAPPRAITITSDGTVLFIFPFHHENFFNDKSIPADYRQEFRLSLEEDMRKGTITAHISPRKVNNLVKAFLDADFFSLKVPPHEDMTDTGWSSLTFTYQGRTRELYGIDSAKWIEFENLCRRIERSVGRELFHDI